MKDKNIIILLKAEKVLDKIQYPLVIKIFTKLGIEEIYLNARNICDKLTDNTCFL
jgi:hypothetical protein